jgi:short-subunit dehydrogenase
LRDVAAKLRVKAVCPGFIETQMTAETMRRRGHSVTGVAYNVDGGWMSV